MLSQERLQSLKGKSVMLARRIEEEERSPSVDTTLLRHLKKQKLEIKETIAGIRADSSAVN